MPSDPAALLIRGKINISCGDSKFSVDFREERTLVEFPSFSQLLKVKSEVDSLRGLISRIPPLPVKQASPEKITIIRKPALEMPEFRLTVRGRSIGKVDFKNGGLHFHLTPFDFITRRMP